MSPTVTDVFKGLERRAVVLVVLDVEGSDVLGPA
jgi:hypothetical protein